MEPFLKIYLPLFIIAFIILVFVVPSIKVNRETGINPFRFITNHDKAHDYVGASMKVFIILILVVVLVYSFSDAVYNFLGPISYLETSNLKIIGLALGHLAVAGIMIAQWQMKHSWRIGIDYQNKTRLITIGLFRISRNPIYLFLIVALIGLFLIIPNALTLAILFAAYLILQVTIRLEEAHLEEQHGEEYKRYKNDVRRLL